MKSGLPINVQDLLLQRGVESLRLEYKAEWNYVCGGAALRTICAFANDLGNVNGGYVLIGVEEADGRPVLPVRGLPEDRLDALQREVRGAIRRIEPTYAPMVIPEKVGDAWILVIVCPGGDGRPYAAPESLAKGAARRPYVRTNSETREARDELERQLREVSQRVPFDDRACYDATPADLSPALVRHHLQQVGSRLAAEGVSHDERVARMHLCKGVNGHAVPRNVALLFFAEQPRRWFHGAHIEISQFPKGKAGREIIERDFEGPLPAQLLAALDYLRGVLPTEIRKIPDQAEARHIAAWPHDAVEEALVNAVHHRGYEEYDPIKVEILPDCLRVISYPGPMPGFSLTEEVPVQGRTIPARNRRIAELLKDLELAEAKGTGIPLIRQKMADNGSPPPIFDFDEGRTVFTVELPIHPDFLRREAPKAKSQPLRLGRPAPPDEVVGRDELVARVLRILDTRSVVLVGPPGRGVSSVLGLVAARLEATVPTMSLDLTGVTIEGLLAALLAWEEQRRGEGEERSERLLGAVSDLEEAQSGRWGEVGPWEVVAIILEELGDRGAHLLFGGVEAFGGDDARHETASLEEALHRALTASPGLRILLDNHRPRQARGSNLWETVITPPLSRAGAEALAGRLLAGVRLPPDDAGLDLLLQWSGGSPRILVWLIALLEEAGELSRDAVTEALDSLMEDPRDRSGLRGRLIAFRDRLRWESWPPPGELRLLDAVAQADSGMPRLDLIASASSSRRVTRLEVLDALRSLLEEGWLVNVDRLICFEHPLLREEFLAWRAQGSRKEDPMGDIPF